MVIDRWMLDELERRRRLIEQVARPPILVEIECLKMDHLHALEPTLRILQQSREQQEALNAALAPTIAASRYLTDATAPWQEAARALRTYEDRFLLPAASEIRELMRTLAEKRDILSYGITSPDIVR